MMVRNSDKDRVLAMSCDAREARLACKIPCRICRSPCVEWASVEITSFTPAFWATYLQGTDVRTEHLVVRSQPLKRWDDVRILPTNRFESTIRIEIPQESMHSFVSEHNSVHWKLVVSGDPERWRPFSRSFSLVVFPDEGKA